MDLDVNGDSHDRGEKGDRKRLVGADGSLTITGQPVSNLGRVAGTVKLLEGATPSSSNTVSASTPEKDPLVKRRKQQDDEELIKAQAMEAASFEEGCRTK